MTSTAIRPEFTILDDSFELDTLVDIVNHGMSSGVGGYIYTSQLISTFDLYEDEIMTYLNFWCDDNYSMSYIAYLVDSNKDIDSLTDIKSNAVWMYVECKAHDILMQEEHPSVY